MKRFRNKYRTDSHRLKGWDYSDNGYYFITIVTHNRNCVFGNIINGNMVLSDFGIIAYNEWLKSFSIRNELKLDEFVIMPNHLHAIVIIDKNNNDKCDNNEIDSIPNESNKSRRGIRPYTSTNGDNTDVDTDGDNTDVDTNGDNTDVDTDGDNTDGDGMGNIYHRKLERKPKSISSFIAGYKSAVVCHIDNFIDDNKLNINKFNRKNPLWQSNYYDHIIRNEISYHNIKNYIKKNPINWDNDKIKK